MNFPPPHPQKEESASDCKAVAEGDLLPAGVNTYQVRFTSDNGGFDGFTIEEKTFSIEAKSLEASMVADIEESFTYEIEGYNVDASYIIDGKAHKLSLTITDGELYRHTYLGV